MAVKNNRKVLDDFTQEYLEKIVPEDIDVTFTIAPVTSISEMEHEEGCEHEADLFAEVLWLFSFAFKPSDDRKARRCNFALAFDAYDDGDTSHLDVHLDSMWETVQFSWQMEGDIEESLGRILTESGEPPLT